MSPFHFPVNLVRLHQAEVEEKPTNIGASAHIMSLDGGFRPPRLYSAALNQTGNTAGLSPEKVLVTPIPLSGPTREDAATAIVKFRLNLALGSSSSSKREEFCFLGSRAVDPTPNIGEGNYIPDLNSSPPDVLAPVVKFVPEIERQNISQFTDFVVGYLEEHGVAKEVAEYKKTMSCKTEIQLGNLDSIRIWNILTLGGEIEKALVHKGVIETPIRFDDLPLPEEQLLRPPHGYKASNHAAIDDDFNYIYNYKPAASWFPYCPDDNETLSDARNYVIPDEDQNGKGKRKAMVDADIGKPYPYDLLQMKKQCRHGGALGALALDKAPIQDAGEDMPSDSSF